MSLHEPNSPEIAAAFDGNVPPGIADCMAAKFLASDLPNGVLRAAAEGRDAQIKPENKEKYEAVAKQAGFECGQAAREQQLSGGVGG